MALHRACDLTARLILRLHDDIKRRAAAVQEQEHRAIPGRGQRLLELPNVMDGLAVYFLDDIAVLDAGCRRRAGGIDIGDNHAGGSGRQAELLRDLGGQILPLAGPSKPLPPPSAGWPGWPFSG